MAGERETTTAGDSVVTRPEVEALFAHRQRAYDDLDADALAADYAADAVIDSPLSGRHGKADAAANLAAVFKAFLDMTMVTEALIIDGNRATQVLQIEGTNIGGLLGLPPSGKPFRIPAVFTYELRNGQIIREQRIYDFTGMLVQVGILKVKPV